ncbi:hypothetical protein SprV_0702393200 [Sparganum proliferum]
MRQLPLLNAIQWHTDCSFCATHNQYLHFASGDGFECESETSGDRATPVGSSVSGPMAEQVLLELEEIAFVQHELAFLRRYEEDTFISANKDLLPSPHNQLNAVCHDIKFTSEEQAPKLLLLDALVRRNLNGKLETMVYRRPTNTKQLLGFHSNHPVVHKRNCVATLFKRIQTHCSKPEDRAREARPLRDQVYAKWLSEGIHQSLSTLSPPESSNINATNDMTFSAK